MSVQDCVNWPNFVNWSPSKGNPSHWTRNNVLIQSTTTQFISINHSVELSFIANTRHSYSTKFVLWIFLSNSVTLLEPIQIFTSHQYLGNRNEHHNQWRSEHYWNWGWDSKFDWSQTRDVNSASSRLTTPVTFEELAREINVAANPLTEPLERLCDVMKELCQFLPKHNDETTGLIQDPGRPAAVDLTLPGSANMCCRLGNQKLFYSNWIIFYASTGFRKRTLESLESYSPVQQHQDVRNVRWQRFPYFPNRC